VALCAAIRTSVGVELDCHGSATGSLAYTTPYTLTGGNAINIRFTVPVK
jgi:hypothetical protein